MTAQAVLRAQQVEAGTRVRHNEIVVGKDILELLSSSMYVDPLTIYREYIQNAADALDESGASAAVDRRVEIHIDPTFRTIRIRDYGVGVPNSDFVRRLTAFGASKKRGTTARGFRGVGRLAGLGYCRELVFRSRASSGENICELVWDCRKLKNLLGDVSYKSDLTALVSEVVSHREVHLDNAPAHFFEVEMRGVVRLKSDRLLSVPAVTSYLEQVAPLPFHPDFSFGLQIKHELQKHVDLGELSVFVNESSSPLCRPYRDTIDLGDGASETITSVEMVHLPTSDGELAAVGWIGHHSYSGAFVSAPLVRGLRARVGNVQVGEANFFEELFPEARFNSWTIGELHLIDPKVVPNGRRDNFEQNASFANLLTNATPFARDVARRCRDSSTERKWVREFAAVEVTVHDKLDTIQQGGLSAAAGERLRVEATLAISRLAQLASAQALSGATASDLKARVEAARERAQKLEAAGDASDPLSSLEAERQAYYRSVVDLVYECSVNRVAARALVERILAKAVADA